MQYLHQLKTSMAYNLVAFVFLILLLLAHLHALQNLRYINLLARPYVTAYGDAFSKLPSCGVGGPNAQAAEAEKILSCNPDIVISEYEDVEKAAQLHP